MPEFDLLVFARWIITIEHDNEVLEHHAVGIKNGRITAILPAQTAQHASAAETVELPNHCLMPGLINLHSHVPMTLLRGLADDLPLMHWLNNHIWPAEGKYVGDEFVFDGTLLGMAEMLRGGTTTVNDMYFFHRALARAGLASGMRTMVGCSILEFPTNYAQNADEYIEKGMAERQAFLGESRITFTLAPHAPYTVSDDTFKKVITLAEREDMLIHCHIHETQTEIDDSYRANHQRPLTRLAQLGLLSPRLIAAHMVHSCTDDIALAAKYGISIAHNPSSNLKLASGIAPVSAMLEAGINVGIGTDGAASNNKLDMLSDIRLTALLAKGSTGNPTTIPAATALRMATLNGAQALGLEQEIGSVKLNKQADLIAIDLSDAETSPVFDPISHIAYAAGREQVSHVWVEGECLLKNRQLTKLDMADIKTRTENWRQRIAGQTA